MKSNNGIKFLLKVYKNLANSDEIKKVGKGNNKYDDLAIYLDFLEKMPTYLPIKTFKQFYYDRYVIREENIPSSYFELRKNLALNMGYGYDGYSEEDKKRDIEKIINDQKESLDRWVNFFVSSDSQQYPSWFKYFCFQGIVRIGHYDSIKQDFTIRKKDTINPFIDINYEALSYMYEIFQKFFGSEKLDDDEMQQLINNGRFSKIYLYSIKKITHKEKYLYNETEGIWKKYNQNSNPEILFNDIQGKNTGWCIAGGIETATSHIKDGDIYVYYTKDSNGEYKLPRIAIKLEYGFIVEIRGIAPDQNLEPNMEQIVKQKLYDFPDYITYEKKIKDMSFLTRIYEKYKKDVNFSLSKEEALFIYEVCDKIQGFGYERDPRILEIIKNRNIKSDLSNALDIDKSKIIIDVFDQNNNDCYYFKGNIEIKDNKQLPTNFPRVVVGNINMKEITDLGDTILPKVLNGNLDLYKLQIIDKLVLPKTLNGDLVLSSLEKFNEIIFPETLNGDLWLDSIERVDYLKLPKEINGDLYLNSLKTAINVIFPKVLNGDLDLSNLNNSNELNLPEILNGSIDLGNLNNSLRLKLPKRVNGNINLGSLKCVMNLELPEYVNGYIILKNLETFSNITFPTIVNGDLQLSNLIYLDSVSLPETIYGTLCLKKLKICNNVKFPRVINGDLNLNNITTIDNVILPESIGGNLYLNNIEYTNDITLPLVNGNIYYKNVTINNNKEKIYKK